MMLSDAWSSRTAGSATNYPLSSSCSFDSSHFSSGSFSAANSGSTLIGGTDAKPAVYDTGTVWVTVNGFQASASYGQGSTPALLAGAIASVFNTNPSSPVTAAVSAASLTLTTNQVGVGVNYPLSSGSSTSNPSQFSHPSFSVSTSGSSLTGGTGAIYTLALGYAPDSDIASANDSVNGNWTYSYDDFNRLSGSNQNSGQAVYSYAYDRFGNRWQQNGPNSMQLSFSGANNRMDGYLYDAAGNLMNDGTHNYSYDAENRIIQVDGTLGTCSTATACYVYDANGRRIRKTTGGASIDYLYDLAGHQIAEFSSSGVWNRGEIYAGSRHLGTYTGGSTYFNHNDWLGTERARTNVSGTLCETVTSLPFGDGQSIAGSCSDSSPMHFTGKPRDSESNLDHFGARHYGSSSGRFMSVDPSRTSIDKSNPQSWNRYPYVYDNPLRLVDDDGKWPTEIHNQIIDAAFPGLSVLQRNELKRISAWVDRIPGGQTRAHNHEHAMKSPGEDPASARQAINQNIKNHEETAQKEQGTAPEHASEIKKAALDEFGQALHTVADRTSPAHTDENGNPRDWSGIPTTPEEVDQVKQHEAEEATATPEQFEEAVVAAQQAFQTTFGDAAFQDATTIPNPPKKKDNQ